MYVSVEKTWAYQGNVVSVLEHSVSMEHFSLDYSVFDIGESMNYGIKRPEIAFS